MTDIPLIDIGPSFSSALGERRKVGRARGPDRRRRLGARRADPGQLRGHLGDLLARWTNDLYRSTAHRVLNNRSGRDRYSVALFYDPDFHARIECLPGCHAADNPPRHAPCTADEHNHEMYCRTRGMPYVPMTVGSIPIQSPTG